MQIYTGMDVGTAKPTVDEMEGIPHRMIDVASPFEKFSVSDYEKMALPMVEGLLEQGKTPIICGGTGFYINSLLYKSQFGNAGANPEIRKELEAFAEEKGKSALHALLREKDPESAEVLHENDVKRVIRALEIYLATGKKKSEQKDEPIPRFDFACVSIHHERERLYERINKRVDIMASQGLMDEVRCLMAQGLTIEHQSMQGIGYKEVLQGVDEGWTEAEIFELIKKNTRNYAKRQITFFKRAENHTVLTAEEATAERVLQLL
jgi:tRNA dimethylallyltransferase